MNGLLDVKFTRYDPVNITNGKSAYELYAETVTDPISPEDWLASLKGDQGDQGEKGDEGLPGAKGDKGESAYDIWVNNGNTNGSLPEFLEWVKGETGAKGDQGDKGDKGDKGEAGPAGLKGDKGEREILGLMVRRETKAKRVVKVTQVKWVNQVFLDKTAAMVSKVRKASGVPLVHKDKGDKERKAIKR